MKKLLFFTLFLFTLLVPAQNTVNKIDLHQGNIQEKFDLLYKKSNNYRQYKIVEHSLLTDLKKQVLDSIQKEKKQYQKAVQQIKSLENKINQLEADMATRQEQIDTLTAEKQSINFFGINFSKEKFKLFFWLLFFIMLSALLYFIYAHRSSMISTREAKKNLGKIEQEYFEFKTNALEREQLLKRQLLDEQKKHQ